MDKEKVNIIIRNLESLIQCLKKELESSIESEPKIEVEYEEYLPPITDYDEVFYEDDDYSN